LKNAYLPVMTILAPIYFVSIGLKTNFAANFDLTIVLLVFFVACIGKILGTGLGAVIGGMTERKALHTRWERIGICPARCGNSGSLRDHTHLWGWQIDKIAPDKFDLIGGFIALMGIVIIMFWPRA